MIEHDIECQFSLCQNYRVLTNPKFNKIIEPAGPTQL